MCQRSGCGGRPGRGVGRTRDRGCERGCGRGHWRGGGRRGRCGRGCSRRRGSGRDRCLPGRPRARVSGLSRVPAGSESVYGFGPARRRRLWRLGGFHGLDCCLFRSTVGRLRRRLRYLARRWGRHVQRRRRRGRRATSGRCVAGAPYRPLDRSAEAEPQLSFGSGGAPFRAVRVRRAFWLRARWPSFACGRLLACGRLCRGICRGLRGCGSRLGMFERTVAVRYGRRSRRYRRSGFGGGAFFGLLRRLRVPNARLLKIRLLRRPRTARLAKAEPSAFGEGGTALRYRRLRARGLRLPGRGRRGFTRPRSTAFGYRRQGQRLSERRGGRIVRPGRAVRLDHAQPGRGGLGRGVRLRGAHVFVVRLDQARPRPGGREDPRREPRGGGRGFRPGIRVLSRLHRRRPPACGRRGRSGFRGHGGRRRGLRPDHNQTPHTPGDRFDRVRRARIRGENRVPGRVRITVDRRDPAARRVNQGSVHRVREDSYRGCGGQRGPANGRDERGQPAPMRRTRRPGRTGRKSGRVPGGVTVG